MENGLFQDKRTQAPIKFKSIIAFLLLFICLVFFMWINMSIFWVVVALIVAFAYYVFFANYFKDIGKNENVGTKT
jgi:Ca2+/Na+ antiporter